MSSGKDCRMDIENEREEKMSLSEKRILFRCKANRLPCSNCPLYKPAKPDKPDKPKKLKK